MSTVIRITYLITLITLAAATIIDKFVGLGFSGRHIYSSWWFAMLWAVLAISGVAYMLRARILRRPALAALHGGLIVILVGALVTHLFGEQGNMHIRVGETESRFVAEDGTVTSLPFDVILRDFNIVNYPATQTPQDYVSQIAIVGKADSLDLTVSINNIASAHGYRFYQASYDADCQGSVLSISHDPVGIAITYVGYGLLFLSLILLLVLPGEGFRRALGELKKKSLMAVAPIIFIGTLLYPTDASAAPDVAALAIPPSTAEAFGKLPTLYNGRICPLQTVARDFTIKMYGRATFDGQNAEQILLGWTLDAPNWTGRKMIKVKSPVAHLLGSDDDYVSFRDLASGRIAQAADSLRHVAGSQSARRALEEAEEKLNIIMLLFHGEMLKLFPLAADDGSIGWYSPADPLPQRTGEATARSVSDVFGRVIESLKAGDFARAEDLAQAIRRFQKISLAEAGIEASVPTDARLEAERTYNSLSVNKPLSMAMATIGLLSFGALIWGWARGSWETRAARIGTQVLVGLLAAAWVYVAGMFVLRWVVCGHVPLSNGFETMHFMALCVVSLALVMERRFVLALPFGFLLAGLSLLVSAFGESNPQITNLMPVLQSPLLSLHVCLVMVSYTLLALCTLCGAAALVMSRVGGPGAGAKLDMLAALCRAVLYPAVATLAAGIFVGAIWANQSWGRYWGWDPKEVWALITLMVYVIPLHRSLVPSLGKAKNLSLFLVWAFLCVIITYFGVNFLLGGMHGYA